MTIPTIPHQVKILSLIFMISFTPFLRSCGDVSYGLPFVSLESDTTFAIKSVRPLILLMNITIVTIFIFCVRFLLRKKKDILTGGTQGVVLYNILTWFGYLLIYPVSTNIKFVEYISGIYLYFLYPFYAFTDDIHFIIPTTIEKSHFFGDADDIPLRLIYIVMMATWFFLGYLRIRITKSKG